MNAIVKQSTGLVPQGFEQAIRFAEMMAKSKMVPKHFQNKPEECLVIIEQAMRWEMSPYAVIQCASMIHERPMYEGKLVAAVVNARGPLFGLQGRLHYAYSGEGQTRKVVVSGKLDGKDEAVEIAWKDAKTTNELWVKQPDQQLAYHGARVWARRHMPELMLGVYAPEEFDRGASATDGFTGTTLEGLPAVVTSEPVKEQPQPPIVDDDPLEETDNKLWMANLIAALGNAESAGEVQRISSHHTVQDALKAAPDKIQRDIRALLTTAYGRFEQPEEPGDTEEPSA
jgi:hypothetical protein